MSLTVGALFAGYGGIELALSSVLDVELAWYAEFDKAPARIMAHHHPGVPNLGDVTKIDWSQVEPVDVITGGSPCQDLSHAGRRKGMTDGTRSNLWVEMREAIATIRPRLVVWENVRGSLSAQADGGAPNGHELCLCGGTDRRRGVRPSGRAAQDDVSGAGLGRDEPARAGSTDGPAGRVGRDAVSAAQGDRAVGGSVDVAPDGRAGGAPAGFGEAVASPEGAAGRPGAGGGVDSLGSGEAPKWAVPIPTPTVMDYKASGGNPHTTATHGTTLTDATVRQSDRWGDYAAAIARAERATGRTAPNPTEPAPKGGIRLSPRFVEWLMMLAAGHVTDVPGLTRIDQLRALGNGVVPPQCAAALWAYIADEWRAAA